VPSLRDQLPKTLAFRDPATGIVELDGTDGRRRIEDRLQPVGRAERQSAGNLYFSVAVDDADL
jgi:hypothetical protein